MSRRLSSAISRAPWHMSLGRRPIGQPRRPLAQTAKAQSCLIGRRTLFDVLLGEDGPGTHTEPNIFRVAKAGFAWHRAPNFSAFERLGAPNAVLIKPFEAHAASSAVAANLKASRLRKSMPLAPIEPPALAPSAHPSAALE